jgi:DNA invertase Pin-like site-specific DNA recombinase
MSNNRYYQKIPKEDQMKKGRKIKKFDANIINEVKKLNELGVPIRKIADKFKTTGYYISRMLKNSELYIKNELTDNLN